MRRDIFARNSKLCLLNKYLTRELYYIFTNTKIRRKEVKEKNVLKLYGSTLTCHD